MPVLVQTVSETVPIYAYDTIFNATTLNLAITYVT